MSVNHEPVTMPILGTLESLDIGTVDFSGLATAAVALLDALERFTKRAAACEFKTSAKVMRYWPPVVATALELERVFPRFKQELATNQRLPHVHGEKKKCHAFADLFEWMRESRIGAVIPVHQGKDLWLSNYNATAGRQMPDLRNHAEVFRGVVEALQLVNGDNLPDVDGVPSNAVRNLSHQNPNDHLETISPATNSIRLKTEVWHLHFGNEVGEYAKRGNQAISWLAMLLAAPNRMLTVADLIGDPENKIAGDAQLGIDLECDPQGIREIKRRMDDIQSTIDDTGGSESLEDELARLTRQLEAAANDRAIANPLKRAHENITRQIRNLMNNKLANNMPQLAAHLKATLQMPPPTLGYYPPAGSPPWQT